MSNEELMKPRYIVEFDEYPNAEYTKGTVIEFEYCEQSQPHLISKFVNRKDGGKIAGHYQAFFDNYPEVFRPLEWYEERLVEDMPEYLKEDFDDGAVFTKKDFADRWRFVEGVLCFFTPATEQEYLNYINQKTTA